MCVVWPSACRVYEFQAVGTIPGDKEATVELIIPDDNLDNNNDNTFIGMYLICADPFGNGTRLSCAPQEYVGPDDTRLVNSSTFVAQCCVSTCLGAAIR